MAAGYAPEIPQNDKWYNVRLGDTVFEETGTLYSTVRYDFKPASIDFTLPGSLRRDSNNHQVTVEHRNKQYGKPPAVYQGHGEACQDLDCILVFDGHSFTLEKLHEATTLKKDRSSGRGAAAGGGAAAAADAANPSPPLPSGVEEIHARAAPPSSALPRTPQPEVSLKAPGSGKEGGGTIGALKARQEVEKKSKVQPIPQKKSEAVVPASVPKPSVKKRGRPPKPRVEEGAQEIEDEVEEVEEKKHKSEEVVEVEEDHETPTGGEEEEFEVEEIEVEEFIEEVEEEVEEEEVEGLEENVAKAEGTSVGVHVGKASDDNGTQVDSGSSGSGSESGSSASKDTGEQESDDDSSASSGDE